MHAVLTVVLVSVVALAGVVCGARDRCDGPKYNCGKRNPCNETLCVEGQLRYPAGKKKYVQCGDDGSCDMSKCARGTQYSQEAGECVTPGDEGEDTGGDEGGDTGAATEPPASGCRPFDVWVEECVRNEMGPYAQDCAMRPQDNRCEGSDCEMYDRFIACTMQDHLECNYREAHQRMHSIGAELWGYELNRATCYDSCMSDPCWNGGVCIKTLGGAGMHCHCPEGFSGFACHIEG